MSNHYWSILLHFRASSVLTLFLAFFNCLVFHRRSNLILEYHNLMIYFALIFDESFRQGSSLLATVHLFNTPVFVCVVTHMD